MSRSTLLLALAVLLACVSTRWLRVNYSPSLPVGLYGLSDVPVDVPRGTLVMLPAPVSIYPWHVRWVPLMKHVAGTAGDTVCHQEARLLVNGADYGPVYLEAHGRPLPHLTPGCQTVPEGMLFLASPAPKSLDSRYFGPVPIATLTAQATPVLTWR